MSEDSKKWGGARAGSGRKSTGHGKYYGFNSTPEVEGIIESLGRSKTEFINAAIVHYCKSIKNQKVILLSFRKQRNSIRHAIAGSQCAVTVG